MPKVPTRMRYRRDNYATCKSWGFDAQKPDSQEEMSIEWFKLILDYEALDDKVKDAKRVKDTYRKLQSMSNDDPTVTATRVASEYLRVLWDKALLDIRKRLPTKDFMESLTCKVMLTKPAIWSQRGCARTNNAIKAAIIPGQNPRGPFRKISIDLVSEPEAAAHAILSSPVITERPDIIKASLWHSKQHWLIHR